MDHLSPFGNEVFPALLPVFIEIYSGSAGWKGGGYSESPLAEEAGRSEEKVQDCEFTCAGAR